MGARESRYRTYLRDRKSAGLKRILRSATGVSAGRIGFDGVEYVNFSGNDYLGLSQHPALVERAQQWTDRYGAGSAASRLVTGNLEPYRQIEAKIAKLKGSEAALVMASGFQANAAVLQALLDKSVLGAEPLVFADRLNHASMHFGCKAADARQIRYRHCDLEHLRELLEKNAGDGRPKFILTESVFSMDGDVARMGKIIALAREHEAFVVCDDAHATGVLGEGGKGLSDDADMVIGTFSKAMGSFGAYVACSQVMRDYLVNRCTGLIYSTALPPGILGAIDAALDLLPELDSERKHVARLAEEFRDGAASCGFGTGQSTTQIVPVIVGEAGDAVELSARLADAGLWVTAIRPPTVPKGTARLRVAFSAAHSDKDLNMLLQALGSGAEARKAAI